MRSGQATIEDYHEWEPCKRISAQRRAMKFAKRLRVIPCRSGLTTAKRGGRHKVGERFWQADEIPCTDFERLREQQRVEACERQAQEDKHLRSLIYQRKCQQEDERLKAVVVESTVEMQRDEFKAHREALRRLGRQYDSRRRARALSQRQSVLHSKSFGRYLRAAQSARTGKAIPRFDINEELAVYDVLQAQGSSFQIRKHLVVSEEVSEAAAELCSICFEPLCDSGNHELKLSVVCGHELHVACLASHVDVKCREAMERANLEMRAMDAELGDEETRAAIFGGDSSLVEMSHRGVIRQCPQCHYGPVINTNCSDMVSHDAARGDGGGRTTNSCPACGFFSDDWREWETWDIERPTAAVLCPLCKGGCHIEGKCVDSVRALLQDVDHNLKETSKELLEACLKTVDLVVLMLLLHAELNKFELEFPVWPISRRNLLLLFMVPDACALALKNQDFKDDLKRRSKLEEEAAVLRQMMDVHSRMEALGMDSLVIAGLNEAALKVTEQIESVNSQLLEKANKIVPKELKGGKHVDVIVTSELSKKRSELLELRCRYASLLHMNSDRGHEEDVFLGKPWSLELPAKPELSGSVVGASRRDRAIDHLNSIRASEWFYNGPSCCRKEEGLVLQSELDPQHTGRSILMSEVVHLRNRLAYDHEFLEGISHLIDLDDLPCKCHIAEDWNRPYTAALIDDLLASPNLSVSIYGMKDIPGLENVNHGW